MTPEIECIWPAENACGESPVWDPREAALYWVDVYNPALWRYDTVTGKVTSVALDRLVGSIGLRSSGGLIAASEAGFATLDPRTGAFAQIGAHSPDAPKHRFNDGKCDRAGRFWAGTVDTKTYGPTGEVFRLDPDGSTHFCGNDLITPNGMAFSPDDTVMYLADSRRQALYAYDFDIASGTISNRRLFASTEGTPARVDGATVDADGFYWCAHVRDWHIACYDPSGALVRRVRMPIEHPLMCTFGGAALDTLFVTSGTFLLKQPEERAAQPLAGGLFAIRGLGARGLAEPFCLY